MSEIAPLEERIKRLPETKAKLKKLFDDFEKKFPPPPGWGKPPARPDHEAAGG
jgi:hypothetical protein